MYIKDTHTWVIDSYRWNPWYHKRGVRVHRFNLFLFLPSLRTEVQVHVIGVIDGVTFWLFLNLVIRTRALGLSLLTIINHLPRCRCPVTLGITTLVALWLGLSGKSLGVFILWLTIVSDNNVGRHHFGIKRLGVRNTSPVMIWDSTPATVSRGLTSLRITSSSWDSLFDYWMHWWTLNTLVMWRPN